VAFVEPNAVQIRITLAEIEPEIWRRVVVPRTFHLGDLHQVIQAAFGWWDYHLHQFMIGGLRYGDIDQIGTPEFEGEPRGFDETEVRLLDFGYSDRVAFVYEYDFGDGWEHIVEFEEKLKLEPAPRVARCTGGARARPPEDVGGVGGYVGFLEIMANRRHPEHADTRRWAGGHFDSEWFDLGMTDRDVKTAITGQRRIRMHQPRPKRLRPPIDVGTLTLVSRAAPPTEQD
jgi:hypothetical protein